MIKFVVDESVDRPITIALSELSTEIFDIARMLPGISDEKVLELTISKKAILITADKDFGELIFRKRLIHQGIVLIRLAGFKPGEKAKIVLNVLKDHIREIPGAFSVVSESGLRIRNYKKLVFVKERFP